MRVLITGAYGLIGSACLARMARDGHEIVGLGRDVAVAQRSFPAARWGEADIAQLKTPEAWRPLLSGVDAVVNCVGVLQDSARDHTHDIHVTATCALFDACARAAFAGSSTYRRLVLSQPARRRFPVPKRWPKRICPRSISIG